MYNNNNNNNTEENYKKKLKPKTITTKLKQKHYFYSLHVTFK